MAINFTAPKRKNVDLSFTSSTDILTTLTSSLERGVTTLEVNKPQGFTLSSPNDAVDLDAILADAEIAFQNNVTERWKADMGSDVKLAKLIRPLTLIALMSMFCLTMIFDSLDNWPFNVKDSYIDLLQILMLTSFGAYFAGRTIEKTKK